MSQAYIPQKNIYNPYHLQLVNVENPTTEAIVVDSLNWALKKLFSRTSLVLIGASNQSGVWKTGKTDFSLYVAKRCLNLGLVSEIASNIDTQGEFPLITDTQTLNSWLKSDARRKLFIFDEGNEHLPNTGFMSSKSTGFKAILPQISKKRGRLIVIAQDVDTLDKTFRSKSWWRGTFKKTSKTSASLTAYWNVYKPLEITGIPKTTVKFDPYNSAEWNEQPEHGPIFFNDKDRQILWAITHEGKTAKELGIHQQELSRIWKKYVGSWLEHDNSPAPKVEEAKVDV